MEGALALAAGRGRAEAEHLDDAGEPPAARLAETVEALGTGELGEHVGQVGGDGRVADRQLRARAPGEGEEEGEERGPVAGHSLSLRGPARRPAAGTRRLLR